MNSNLNSKEEIKKDETAPVTSTIRYTIERKSTKKSKLIFTNFTN